MKDRIIQVRKNAGLSQNDFADKLNLSRNFISLVENGNRDVSDRTINDICREFNVNEKWLRTGKGTPTVTLTRKQVIADFMGDMLKEEEESFKSRLIEALANLDVDDWLVLEKIADSLQKKD